MKKIDFQFYEKARGDFVATFKRRNPKNWEKFNNELSLYCACFGLPVIVAIAFSKDAFPEYLKELEEKEKIVVEFYGYEQV